MSFSLHALNSRVSRRIGRYFLIAALVPLIILSTLIYNQMNEELQQQVEISMRKEAKSFGMAVYDHLRLLKDELALNAERIVALNNRADKDKNTISIKMVDSTLVKQFFKLKSTGEIVTEGDAAIMIDGAKLYKAIYNNKILNKPLLLSFPTDLLNTITPLYLIVPIDPSSTESDFIGAELNSYNILGVEMMKNSDDLICILDESGIPIYCNRHSETRWITSVTEHQNNDTSGFYLWQGKVEEQYTAFWSVFLDSHYQIDKWTVVIATNENPAIDSLNRIQSFLIKLALFVGFIVILLSLPIIRGRILPLEKILAATRELAKGDFKSKVVVDSNDEFQEIGEAFNSMAEKLGKQFEYQSVLSIIGSQLIKADSVKSVFRIIHQYLMQIIDITAVGIVNIDKEDAQKNGFYYPIDNDFSLIDYKQFNYQDQDELPDHLWSGQGNDMLQTYPFLNVLLPENNESYILIPVMKDGTTIALFAVALKKRDPSIVLLLEQIGDITSNALSNIILTREIKFQANHDSLTKLPNRYLFQDRLNQAIHKAKRDKSIFAILYFDLDRFKEINDSLGHTLGDEVLKIIASRLIKNLRHEDTIARLGGDEFIFITGLLSTSVGAAVMAEKLKAVLESPIYSGGHELYVTGSIGISLYPQDGLDADTLIRNADAAMYKAKDEGINAFQFYTPSMTESALERINMEKDIRNALIRSEFQLHYQPQYNLKSGKLMGFEALIRWQHPLKGNLSPYFFIPIAEETGLIIDIGNWVIKTACLQICEWKKQNRQFERVAVNISSKQLMNSNLIDVINTVLKETGCKPEWLELEVTEGYLMTDPKSAIEKLQELRALGISLAVDDFGTGYSSLSYLKKLPITKLKIDKSFVDDLPNSQDDIAITKAIIALGKSMNLKLIAEGVETVAQKEFLQANGCDEVQGYLYSKPRPVEEMSSIW